MENTTRTILAWLTGGGIVLSLVGGLAAWAMTGIGSVSERPGMAARGKTAIMWAMLAPAGMGVMSGILWAIYETTQ